MIECVLYGVFTQYVLMVILIVFSVCLMVILSLFLGDNYHRKNITSHSTHHALSLTHNIRENFHPIQGVWFLGSCDSSSPAVTNHYEPHQQGDDDQGGDDGDGYDAPQADTLLFSPLYGSTPVHVTSHSCRVKYTP